MRPVYQNVDLIRESAGISKRHLASQTGMSEMSCSNALSGKSKISAERLRDFAAALKITDINVFYDDSLTDKIVHENSTCTKG